jgi:hypothetical protein
LTLWLLPSVAKANPKSRPGAVNFWKALCALTLREPMGIGLSLGLGGKVNRTGLGIMNCLALTGAVQIKN